MFLNLLLGLSKNLSRLLKTAASKNAVKKFLQSKCFVHLLASLLLSSISSSYLDIIILMFKHSDIKNMTFKYSSNLHNVNAIIFHNVNVTNIFVMQSQKEKKKQEGKKMHWICLRNRFVVSPSYTTIWCHHDGQGSARKKFTHFDYAVCLLSFLPCWWKKGKGEKQDNRNVGL